MSITVLLFKIPLSYGKSKAKVLISANIIYGSFIEKGIVFAALQSDNNADHHLPF